MKIKIKIDQKKKEKKQRNNSKQLTINYCCKAPYCRCLQRGLTTPRSSHLQMFFQIGVPKYFAYFKRLQHRYFPMKLANFLKIPFFIEHF